VTHDGVGISLVLVKVGTQIMGSDLELKCVGCGTAAVPPQLHCDHCDGLLRAQYGMATFLQATRLRKSHVDNADPEKRVAFLQATRLRKSHVDNADPEKRVAFLQSPHHRKFHVDNAGPEKRAAFLQATRL